MGQSTQYFDRAESGGCKKNGRRFLNILPASLTGKGEGCEFPLLNLSHKQNYLKHRQVL